MAIPLFLAMTGAEFTAAGSLPKTVAWMACHFSAPDRGLTGFPPALPPGSLLMLNDQIPMAGHDPQQIGAQLQQAAETLDCCGVLLDFQRPGQQEAAKLAAHLVATLTCPVAVSDGYAKNLDCPVFLAPCPHHVPLSDHLLPWRGRQLWLDLAADAETITLTKQGSQFLPLLLEKLPQGGHSDDLLHCHYAIETTPEAVRFTLWRTQEDLDALALEAETLGVEALVGLYAECGARS